MEGYVEIKELIKGSAQVQGEFDLIILHYTFKVRSFKLDV